MRTWLSGVVAALSSAALAGEARAFEIPIELEVVAVSGAPAPDIAEGLRFVNPGFPDMSAAGEVVFSAALEGAGPGLHDRAGIWHWKAGQGTRLLVRNGDPVADVAGGVVTIASPELNARGDIAFNGTVWVAGIPETAIVASEAGVLRVRARRQSPIQALSEILFAGFGYLHLNEAGRIAFSARVSGPGIDTGNDLGIWGPRAQFPLQVLVRERTPIPAPLLNRQVAEIDDRTRRNGGQQRYALGR